MKKEHISFTVGILVLLSFFGLVYLLFQLPEVEEEQNPQTTQEIPQNIPQDGNFNPNYGDLSEEQIQVADIAVGALLNGTEGLTPPMISVKSFEEQTFPSTALGCPQEGEVYADVLTEGYRVVLTANALQFDYRLTDHENVFLCE